MLLHLVPKILNRYQGVDVSLVDVQIPEINLTLKAEVDLVVRKPFPNKCYFVACRKVGRKAICGLYLDVDKQLESFSVITRWEFNAEQILTHEVNYKVADTDYDAISDDHTMLYAQSDFESRWITDLESNPPVNTQPRMDVLLYEHHSRGENVSLQDDYLDGILVKRVENITIPTIETERLTKRGMLPNRMPDLEHRFTVKG
ncbi:DUF6012 family protein [Vibrio cyclitrophicus]